MVDVLPASSPVRSAPPLSDRILSSCRFPSGPGPSGLARSFNPEDRFDAADKAVQYRHRERGAKPQEERNEQRHSGLQIGNAR
jgi:hypothetical protein